MAAPAPRDRTLSGQIVGVPAALAVRSIGENFPAERERWALWLPVGLGIGIGIGIYFALPAEPPWWLGPAALAAAVAASLGARRRPLLPAAALALGAIAAGFAVAQWRAAAVAAPVLAERLGPVAVSGRVIEVEAMDHGSRVTLDRLSIPRLPAERTPARARLRLAGQQPTVEPGDRISVRAMLSPPLPPAAPGAFDFQRQAYFRQLGAVGFSLGPAALVEKEPAAGLAAFSLAVARVRQHVSDRVLRGLDGPPGTIAAALMTGVRGAIPDDVMAAMRDSGLAHLLAISGLNIGLAAGIVFVGVRGALALVRPLALRYPIKKWAAAAAIGAAFAYTLLAGAPVPAQRAFLMIGLVFLAVLFDRRGISMRLMAWAAAIILILQPETLLDASLQMSFAAVVALIAAYEAVQEHRRLDDRPPPSWRRRAVLYLGGVALTTLVAGAATAPFVVYHFNRFALHGLAANLVAVPVTALWIMPWAVVAFLLMPVGLEAWALMPMGWGIEVVIRVAETVSRWPAAVALLPAMSTPALALLSFGGLWLCLWRRRWRLWGLAGIAAGLASIALSQPPDILIDGRGRLLAVRTASGLLALSSNRVERLSRETWLRRMGQEEAPPAWPAEGFSADRRLSCDGAGCIYRLGGQVVALVRQPQALAEDCRIADVVVSAVPVRRPCPSAHTVIDRFDLWRRGGHALWLENGGVRVESVDQWRGRRPWVAPPGGRGGGA